jgi:hypothetical protein
MKQLKENPWLTGMTLRDVFAASVVQGLYAYGDSVDNESEALAIWAVADLMVSTREGVKEK